VLWLELEYDVDDRKVMRVNKYRQFYNSTCNLTVPYCNLRRHVTAKTIPMMCLIV